MIILSQIAIAVSTIYGRKARFWLFTNCVNILSQSCEWQHCPVDPGPHDDGDCGQLSNG